MQRFRPVALAAALLTSASCTVQDTEIPGLTGPSDYALSVSMTATPDVINQDGVSQSSVIVVAHGPDGRPLAGLGVRIDIMVDGTVVDYGTLSGKNVVTNAEGRASAVYTAPGAPPLGASAPYRVVTIAARPVGSNYENTTAATADIRLNTPGVIIPPADAPIPSFTASPGSPSVGTEVFFDASASTPGAGASSIVNYQWAFGDGNSGSGPHPEIGHVFTLPGDYTVRLTVTNDRGVSAQTTRTLTVGTGTAPTADFVFSPTQPAVGQSVQFNGTLSKTGPGRAIVSWSWNFGDGTSGSGSQPTHTYATPGAYNVVLRVVDSADQEAVVSKIVAVGSGNPIASFTMSPQPPVSTATNITFDGSGSAASPGATIVSYSWTFGDGTGSPSSASPTAQKGPVNTPYPSAGTYSVTLTVTDSLGRTGSASQSVRVE